ncbi:MAG: hypothetical protein WCO86_01880 [Planctomycetota bacterium]
MERISRESTFSRDFPCGKIHRVSLGTTLAVFRQLYSRQRDPNTTTALQGSHFVPSLTNSVHNGYTSKQDELPAQDGSP